VVNGGRRHAEPQGDGDPPGEVYSPLKVAKKGNIGSILGELDV
jgi:hypothetical protein